MTDNSGSRIKILCVDDSDAELLLCETYLTASGFEVTTACGSEPAMELIRSFFFDIAVLDYQMPRVNGLELAQQIREVRRDLPIILFSGALPSRAQECLWIDRAVDKNDGTGALLNALHDLIKTR